MKHSPNDAQCVETVAKIETLATESLQIDSYENYQKKAELLMEGLTEFRNLLKRLQCQDFRYYDVVKEEQASYMRRCVTILDNFTAAAFHIPFTILTKASCCVVTSNGQKLPYPERLKIGNEAIGQAWLANNKEVFSPRQAIAHSMNATATNLLKWVKEWKENS